MTALKDEGLTKMIYVKGVVVGDVTIDDGDASFSIGATADATTDLMKVIKAKGLENQNCAEDDVKAGDEVVINANLHFFEGEPETWRGYIYSINGQTSKSTGIETITAKKLEKATIYNLLGVRMGNAQKGLSVINGKKVMMK